MHRRALSWFFLTAFVTTIAVANDAPAKPRSLPTPLGDAKLDERLSAAAKRDGIAISGLAPLTADPGNGDAVVAWIGTSRNGKLQQWLVQLRRARPTDREIRAARGSQRTKYLSWGPVVTFKSDLEALDLWIAGPVDPRSPAHSPVPPATTRRARVVVPGDYLRLGLDRAAMIDLHLTRQLKALQQEDPNFKIRRIFALEKPIPEATIAEAKPIAEALGFTPEIERAWAGASIALHSFLLATEEVPTLHDIAQIAVEKPGVLKLLKALRGTKFLTHLGGGRSRPVDPAHFGLLPVSTAAFELPFSMAFGGDAIVSGRLIVTGPQPPLDVSAGILGLIAVHPKDNGRMVHLALLSATRGGK
jgi:hypothetical protein